MEYLTRRPGGRIILVSILVGVVLCTFLRLGKAEDNRESESSSDSSVVGAGGDGGGTSDSDGGEEQSTPAVEADTTSKVQTFETYKQLFNQNRATQLSGVKALLKFGNDEQRYSLVQVLLKQLFKTLDDAKQNLTTSGYTPGDEFPTNEVTINAFSKILENTALFGDIALRLPDAVHSIYDREKEWQVLMVWCYSFCKDSGVYEGVSWKLLHLMAQEIKIIPKEPSFINPFKEADSLEMERMKAKKVEKKPKKKIARGPRLRHTEL